LGGGGRGYLLRVDREPLVEVLPRRQPHRLLHIPGPQRGIDVSLQLHPLRRCRRLLGPALATAVGTDGRELQQNPLARDVTPRKPPGDARGRAGGEVVGTGSEASSGPLARGATAQKASWGICRTNQSIFRCHRARAVQITPRGDRQRRVKGPTRVFREGGPRSRVGGGAGRPADGAAGAARALPSTHRPSPKAFSMSSPTARRSLRGQGMGNWSGRAQSLPSVPSRAELDLVRGVSADARPVRPAQETRPPAPGPPARPPPRLWHGRWHPPRHRHGRAPAPAVPGPPRAHRPGRPRDRGTSVVPEAATSPRGRIDGPGP